MKGLFTQSAYILTDRAPELDELESVLSDLNPLGFNPEAGEGGYWAFGEAAVILPMGDFERGRVVVDVIPARWPDQMADAEENPQLFGAWTMGGLGPAVHPGCLERAGKQAWAWKQASAEVRRHEALVRVRTTYVGDGDELELPEGYDATAELLLVTRVAARLMELDGALAYFNPNGESLRPAEDVKAALQWYEAEEMLPLDLWANVRLGRVAPDSTWLLMETVGLGQIGLPDVEVPFDRAKYPPEHMDPFVRNIALYLAEEGDVIATGNVVEGPAETSWVAERRDVGATFPSRPVLRLLPEGEEPPAILKALE